MSLPAPIRFIAGLILCGASIASAQELPPLIQQLGDKSFQRRIDAEQKLMGQGPAGLQQVQQGVQSTDPEIHQRSLRLITQLQRLAFTQQRDKIRQNPWAVDPALVPAWEHFQDVAGDSEGSRIIYSAMLDAEPDLMMAVSTKPGNWSQDFDARCLDLSRVLAARGSRQIKAIHIMTLTLLSTHPDNDISPVAAGSLMALLSDGDFASAVRQLSDDEREACRSVIGRWVQSPTHASAASRLQLAILYQLPEGAVAAREFLEIRKSLGGSLGQLQNAINFLAQFGDESDIPLLEGMLDESRLGMALHSQLETDSGNLRELPRIPTGGESSPRTEDVRVNDAALYALSVLAKMGPLDMGFSRGPLDSQGKPSVRMPATFPNETQRLKAMSRWLEWRTQNSLQLNRNQPLRDVESDL